jgi:RIO kinase 1
MVISFSKEMTGVAGHFHSLHLTWEIVDEYVNDERSAVPRLEAAFSPPLRESPGRRHTDHTRSKIARRLGSQMAFHIETNPRLRSLVDKGILQDLSECISASKGSAVFIGLRGAQAPQGWPEQFAVKIRSAPLKLNAVDGSFTTELVPGPIALKAIATCTKDEYRAITRIYSHGLPSPCPLLVSKGIVLMELISDDGAPAPSLRDATLDASDYDELYNQVLIGIRRTFHRCALIRADLSEHTVLVRRKRAVWAGAARVVEWDCPVASVVLRRGIAAITNFFEDKGIKTAPMMRAFQFVVARRLESGLHAALAELRREPEGMSVEEFLGRFAPYTLAQVTDAETARGLVRVEGQKPFEEEEDQAERDDLRLELESESDDDDSEEEDVQPIETLDRKLFTRDEWKAKVREVKVANRERRQTHKPRLDKRKQNRCSHHNAK